MTDRERLLKILNVPIHPHENVDPLEAVADFLLDNGVTFASENNVGSKWIPVTEILPQENKRVLACDKYKIMVVARLLDGKWVVSWNHEYFNTTHWMLLPEPLQEE